MNIKKNVGKNSLFVIEKIVQLPDNTPDNIQKILSADFTYELPEEKIAIFPLEKRNQSKLLVYQNNTISEDNFCNIAKYIPNGANLVLNNTKVIPARLLFKKDTGATIEVFCLEPQNETFIGNALKISAQSALWYCMVKNKTKWKPNDILYKQCDDVTLSVRLTASDIDGSIILFEWNKPSMSFDDILLLFGEMPIPPYFKRAANENDKHNYQTTFSKKNGSVAAPTASLHFTTEEFLQLQEKKISVSELTLHVGAGTFKPIKTTTIAAHAMHSEWIEISYDFIQKQAQLSGEIVAVGTTVLRSLESLYFIAQKIKNNVSDLTIYQWESYTSPNKSLEKKEVFLTIAAYMRQQQLDVLQFKSQLMIIPGYQFHLCDFLVTNFHQPHSTLLLLVAAAVGEDWRKIYKYALANNFRFLSYGDSSILQIKKK